MARELTLQEIQKISLDVLIQFDKVCREQGFRYCLAYGTLIGAIRHGGFIPWDDDVDVWMPRKDFEAFKSFCLLNEKQMWPNKLCCRENTQNYTYYIPRFCNQEYQYVSLNNKHKNPEIGVFIDIYPLDNYGDSQEKGIELAKRISRINRKYAAYVDPRSDAGGVRNFVKHCLHYSMRLFYGKKYYLRAEKKIEILLSKYTNENDTMIGVPAWEPEEYFIRYPKELFAEFAECRFEGKVFFIPQRYDEILKIYYGDYMKLPPEEEQRPSHNYKIYERQAVI